MKQSVHYTTPCVSLHKLLKKQELCLVEVLLFKVLIIYSRNMFLNCGWLIPVQLIPDNSASICYHSARICYHSASICYHSARICYHSARICYHSAKICYHSVKICYHSARICYHSAKICYHSAKICYHSANICFCACFFQPAL